MIHRLIGRGLAALAALGLVTAPALGQDMLARSLANQARVAAEQAVDRSIDVAEPALPVTPKFFLGQSSTRAYIMSAKPGGAGGVMWQVETGNVDTSPSSLGTTAETWRTVSVTNLIDAAIFKAGWAATSGTWTEAGLSPSVAGITGSTSNIAKYPSGASSNNTPRAWSTTTNGDYRDFAITADRQGAFNIAFVMTADGGNAEVSEAATGAVIATVNTARTGATDALTVRRFQWKQGAYTIRVKHAGTSTTQRVTYAGVMWHFLGDPQTVTSNVYDAYAYWRDDNNYTNTAGAIDYAFLDSASNKYGGSFHGGETIVGAEQEWRFDGLAGALQVTLFRAARDIAVKQRSLVDWTGVGGGTVELWTTKRWRGDGSQSLDAVGKGTNFQPSYAYTLLHTTALGFTNVLWPKRLTLTGDGHYPVGKTNRIVQENPTTGQRVTVMVTRNNPEQTIYGGARVQFNSGQWIKPYYGPAVGVPTLLTDFAWRSLHIYE